MKGFGIISWCWALYLAPQADAIQLLAASSLTEAMKEATKGDDVSLGFGASGRIAHKYWPALPSTLSPWRTPVAAGFAGRRNRGTKRKPPRQSLGFGCAQG